MLALKLVPLAAALILAVALAPLAVFFRDLATGSIPVEAVVVGEEIVLRMNYSSKVSLWDARLEIRGYSNGSLVERGQGYDDRLVMGETLEASIPLGEYDEVEIVLRGRVEGLYEVSLSIRLGAGVVSG